MFFSFKKLGRALLLSAAVAVLAGWLVGCDNVKYSSFTDDRDGQIYKTVEFGRGTWMAQNLNYQSESGSWCYDNSESNCKKYGRLYDYFEAATVCPTGWHLPASEQWQSLVDRTKGDGESGRELKGKDYWDGSCKNYECWDTYGFTAYPGGYRSSGGSFDKIGKYGYWWTSTEYSNSSAYCRYMVYNSDGMWEETCGVNAGLSVRCKKD